MRSRNLKCDLGRRKAGLVAVFLLPVVVGACSTAADKAPGINVIHGAVEGADCGYAVASKVHGVSKKGFQASIDVTNVSGATSSGFKVLVGADKAQLVHVAHGSFEAVESGFLLSPLDSIESSRLDPGQTYSFELKFEGEYTEVTPNIISNNGVACDQTAPNVTLAVSGDFFTATGTLRLSADAKDNVAVAKVVFSQDGVQIGATSTAPYTLDVPVTSALNGRHRYTAVAYDLTGNTSEEAKRVLVAIDNKFFGTAVSTAADYAPPLLTYFDQLTPGNAGKWGSVESVRGTMNWTELDMAYNFAKANGSRFKFHTLIWGQQQPSWIASLSAEEQLAEIDQWMAAVAERYPDLTMIDVVNEPMHAVPGYSAALGGAGKTGWDWVITAFQMARKHFPNAELILNEYNVLIMESFTSDFVKIVRLLQERGLIDGIGEQAHFLERAELPVVAANLNTLAATGLPIYISELDIDFANDARQASVMSQLLPIFWQHPSVVGVTHWGYRVGAMWQTNAGLLRTDGTLRPALAWIRCYVTGGASCPVPAYVPVARTGSEYELQLEAEDYDQAQGLIGLGTSVAYTDDGDWMSYARTNLKSSWNKLWVTYAKGNADPGSITVHLGSLQNAPVVTVQLPSTGGWGTSKTIEVPWTPVAGEYTVYVQFHNGYGVANVDSIRIGTTPPIENVLTNGEFESNKDGWYSWGGTTVATSTSRYHSGKQSLTVTGGTKTGPAATELKTLVVPGETYKASAWVTIGGAASAPVRLTLAMSCKGAGSAYSTVAGNVTVSDGQWTQISGAFTVDPYCLLDQVQLYVEGDSKADLYVDDVVISGPVNLITNGSFEGGTSGWYTWSGTLGTAPNAGALHYGKQSLSLSNTNAVGPAATDLSGRAKVGKTYQLSAWVSVGGDASAADVKATLAMNCGQNTGYAAITSYPTVNAGQWVQLTGEFTIPASCTLSKLELFFEGGNVRSAVQSPKVVLYVDDVAVKAKPAAVNLLNNGNFESGTSGWYSWNGTVSATAERAHGGSQSLLVSGGSKTGPAATNVTSLVKVGSTYAFSFWVTIGGPDSAAVRITRAMDCGTGAAYDWVKGNVTVSNGVWAELAGQFTIPASCALKDLQLFAEGDSSAKLYLDDVTLSLVQ